MTDIRWFFLVWLGNLAVRDGVEVEMLTVVGAEEGRLGPVGDTPPARLLLHLFVNSFRHNSGLPAAGCSKCWRLPGPGAAVPHESSPEPAGRGGGAGQQCQDCSTYVCTVCRVVGSTWIDGEPRTPGCGVRGPQLCEPAPLCSALLYTEE